MTEKGLAWPIDTACVPRHDRPSPQHPPPGLQCNGRFEDILPRPDPTPDHQHDGPGYDRRPRGTAGHKRRIGWADRTQNRSTGQGVQRHPNSAAHPTSGARRPASQAPPSPPRADGGPGGGGGHTERRGGCRAECSLEWPGLRGSGHLTNAVAMSRSGPLPDWQLFGFSQQNQTPARLVPAAEVSRLVRPVIEQMI